VLKDRIPARGAVAAATVVAAASAVTVAANAWPAEGRPRGDRNSLAATAEPAPDGPIALGAKPPGDVVQRLQVRQRHRAAAARAAARAARAAREAREQRAAASRSASRIVSYDGDPRGIARAMMAERYGWGSGEYACLSSLWERESGWQVHASNPSSGAYGIPQALPGSKMSAYGSDWADNPVTQIEWGLAYIRDSYGTPCGAWSTFRSLGWY
jgi:hypothetical protein